MTIILILFSIIFITYFVVAWKEIYNSQDSCHFVYPWAWWIGAFVWEDVLIFSLLHLAFAGITWITHDIRIGILLIGIFWTIRSAGETLYFFLQQFHRPDYHPHNLTTHFESFKPLFGHISPQKGYIIMQTLHQSVVVLAVSALALLAVYWDTLPVWF